MLTPMLELLKQKLAAKGSAYRTAAEDRLLEELDDLDNSQGLRKAIRDENLGIKGSITSGGGGCPCCGR